MWESRWEVGWRNDFWMGRRFVEVGSDGEGVLVWLDGVEEGLGEGIRKRRRRKKIGIYVLSVVVVC